MKGGTTDKRWQKYTKVKNVKEQTIADSNDKKIQKASNFAGHSLHFTAEAVIHSIHSELNGPGRVGSRLEMVEGCWRPLSDGPWYPIYIYMYNIWWDMMDYNLRAAAPAADPGRIGKEAKQIGIKTLRCFAPWGFRPFSYVYCCEIYLIGLNFHL